MDLSVGNLGGGVYLDKGHPLNVNRLFWFLPLPGQLGGNQPLDLVSGLPVSLKAFPGVTAFPQWSNAAPGSGMGSISFAGDVGGDFGYLTTPNSALAPATFTVACWINPSGSPSTWDVFCKPTSGNPTGSNWGAPFVSFLIRLTSSTQITASASPGNAFTSVSFTAGSSLIGAWHRIVFTYNGATLQLYLDGKLVASTAATGAITYSSTQPFQIGIGNGGAGEAFDGGITDCSFSAGAWPATLIKLDYDLGRQNYPGVLVQPRARTWSVPSSGGTTLNAAMSAKAITQSSLSGALALAAELSAKAISTVSLPGSLALAARPFATATTTAALPGSLGLTFHVTAAAATSASLSATATVGALFAHPIATATTAASLSANLSLPALMSASAQTASVVEPSLGLAANLSAKASTVSSVQPSLSLSLEISARATTSASVQGRLALSASIVASATSSASVSGIAASVIFAAMSATARTSASLVGTVTAALTEPCFVFREAPQTNVFREAPQTNVFR